MLVPVARSVVMMQFKKAASCLLREAEQWMDYPLHKMHSSSTSRELVTAGPRR